MKNQVLPSQLKTNTRHYTDHVLTTLVRPETVSSSAYHRMIMLLFAAALLWFIPTESLQAQVANYSFTASSGTYTPLVAPTNVFPSGWDDNGAVSVPLGFTFTFNSVPYTTAFVHPNGYITFGSSTSGYVPISGGSAVSGVISAWGRDLQAQNTAPLGSVDYVSSGGVFTVQWSNTRRYNSTTINAERFEMQIQLIQATGVIQLVYGAWSDAVSAITTNVGEVGLRGTSGTDFKNLSVLSGGSWAAPVAGAVNTATCFYNESNVATKPANGQTYTFTPPPPCVAPANQPTALMLTPAVGSIAGSFTAAAGLPSGYLVVRTATNVPPSAPVNGTTYVAGTSALGGVIVSSSALTTFTATGLNPSTQYYFWIYSFNNTICSGGPVYLTASPLTGNTTTNPCAISGTRTVGPTGFYNTLTAAFTDLNANGVNGPVILELQSAYVSSVEPAFPVVVPVIPCISAINNVVVRPEPGATALALTSASTTGTINFDAGDFVTFDGRPGGVGVSQLTISNTATAGYAIQFINSATFNTIKYCTVAGVNTGTTSGVIFFSTAVGFATGNSNNTIDNCDLRDGATTPNNLIYASGTTTSYAVQNNNITISNNTIHDWFNATSTTASAAINVVGGASDWTITGNSFYQTTTRTFTMTTATDQGAIFINSAVFGTNFTISNNFIGGTAPSCGGTPWTWTGGTTGTPTPRLIRFAAALGAFSNISNNTIANLALTTSTTNNGSSLIAHISGNININGNTLGSQSTTGNITFTLANATAGVFFLPIGFGTGAVPCTINITNNNLGSITAATSSTGSISFRVIYGQPAVGSQVTINNNLIGGTVANSIQQLTNNIFTGVLILNPTIGGVYTNNTVRNLTLNNTGVTGSIRGIDVQASGGGHTITGNTVFNLTTNATNVAVNNAASIVGITMTGSVVGGSNISNNTIYNLVNTNATLAGWINGMYFGTGLAPQPNTIISKNLVHSINLSSPLAGMAGIFLPNTGNARVYNNMVRLGIDANGLDITNSLQINGIYKAASGSMSIYHNTVYIGGTGVASGAVNTYAFRRSVSPLVGVDTVMNNIFYNTRSNVSGTGKHYAANLNANTSLQENYNVLLANGTGGVLGLLIAADFTTLATWQAGTNQDWNSVSSDPKLVNPNGDATTVDLHIQAASATPVEQGGYNLPLVTIDFDLQTRSSLTPVDIGADAGNFLLLDLSAPAIYYSPIAGTSCNSSDQTLSGVNITDASGIPTAGALRPRIYYRKNAGAYFSQPGTFVSGSATNSFWNFTILAADMGGLAPADVVSYYVIAQDIAGTPNIGSNPAGVIATDVNTVTTPPVTPNTYTVNALSLSGTYTVGAAGNYTTLTAAVTAYNTACIGGPVVFSLIDATYPGETFPITINANAFASAVNTLTIKPAPGVSPSISGTSASALIVLNGADWVTIDGSNGFTPNNVCPPSAATRDLTLTNTSTSTTSAVIWLQTATTGLNAAANNRIMNINLVGSGNTQTLFGVGAGSTTIATTSLGSLNNNNAYINNNISNVQYGIYSQGSSIGGKNTGTIINQNRINTAAPNNVRRAGVFVGFENNIIISGNNISEIASATTVEDVFGITLGTNSISTSTFTGNEVTNAIVSNNIIGSVRQTATYSACGILAVTAVSGTNQFYNNMISGVSSNGTSGDFSVGMLIGGGNGSTTKINYNTITMTSVPANTGATDKSFALAIGGVNPVVDIRNNILVNNQNNGTANDYAIVYGYTPFSNLTSDHNDYSVPSGSPFFVGATASIAAPTNQLTLANLQAATGKDGAGQTVTPVFVSPTDLHLTAAANQCLDGEGTPIMGISTDIDCQVRNATTPDIGADEFAGDISTIAVTETSGLFNNDGIICAGASATITATGGGTYLWSTGETTPAINVSPSGTTLYSVSITNGTCVEILSTNITVNPVPAAAIVVSETSGLANNDGSICAGASATLTASGGGTYLWSTGATTVAITVTPAGTTTYTVTVTNANGCTATASTTITVNPIPTAGITVAETSGTTNNDGTICAGASATLTASGGGTYLWSTGATTMAITVTPVGTTPYTVTVTNASGCTATASTTITVNPLPVAGITVSETSGSTPNDGAICAGSSVTLTGTGGGTYLWSTGATTTSITVNPTMTTLYTVTVTSNGCTAAASVNITVNAGPLYTFSVTNPSNCNTADGAISITMTAGQAPFTFAWTTPNGCGVSATAQNQTGLCAGAYFMTVTDNNGCSNTGVFSLDGPAPGCFSCPTIGSLSAVPATVCENDQVTLTANGLSGMGVTYGITFVYFTSIPANPYIGGTVIATVPNAALGGGGTMAQTSTTFATGNTYYIYANLSPVPTDPVCRPTATDTLVVNPIPQVNGVTNQTYCAGATVPSVVFTSSVPGAVFSWSRTNEAIGLGVSSGTGNVPSFTATNAGTAPLTSTFSVVASFTNNGVTCTGTPIQFTITVNPNPQINAVANQTYCVGSTVPSIVFSGNVPGAVYSWSRTNEAIGLGTNSGTGNIPSFTAANAGTTPLTSTFSVVASFTNNGVTCSAAPIQFTITVNPTPQVNAVPNQTYCSGSSVPSIVFSSNVAGATFSWSRTNEAIGLGTTAGTGSVPTFTATNAGGAPLTSTFSVVASFTNNGVTCTGTPRTFTITSNPTPQVNAVTSQTYCAGAMVPSIIFTGNVPGATYTWSRTTEAIGLGVNSGTASVPAFTAANTGVTPLTSTFTVTPSYTNNGLTCTGTPITFTITINPVPTINAVANQTYCAGSTVPAVVFTSNVPGVVFNWSRTAAAIGLAPTSGTGSVPTYTATNPGSTPISSTFTASASYTNNGVTCTSAPITFTVTINPTPVINPVPNQTYCASGNIPPTFFTSNVPAAVYTWSRSGDDIGLGPVSGTGPIPSFTGVNNTTGPLTATFTVVATYSNNGVTCTSSPIQFTITICYALHVNIQGDAYVCPGEIETYFIDNYNPNSTYTWTLQNGGGVITADNGSSITVDWQDTPGGPFIIQVDEAGCGDACHAYDFFPVYVQGVEAISCNDHVQISLNENCVAEVLSGMILEGETEGNDNYFVQLTDAFGNIIPDATLTVDQIGQTVTAMVLNECNGQSCLGTISVEDKIKPVIECTDVTISCGTSLEPVYEPPVTGFIQQAINSGLSIGPNAGTVTTQDLTLDLPTNAVLTDLNVLVDLNHTWVGDLSVELISPAGTTVLLVNQLCGSVDNWANVIFDDQASVSVTASCNPQPPALTGSVIPQGSLAAVNGESAVGTWTLRVTDNVGGDGGTLNTFGLNVSYFLAVTSAPYAYDACGEVELTYTDSESGDDCEEQILTRTWTATDGSGNTSTCIQTITILPLTLDNIVFPPAYVGVCGESALPDHTGWPTVDGNPITEDNSLCNIFVGYWDKELNECGGGRKIARTWTVLNWCTVEVVEAVQVIKLSDNVGPELTCPADYEVGTDFWYCYANVSVPKPIAVDECSEIASYSLTSSDGVVVSFGNNFVINGLPVGTHTVTWTVYDECGNSSTCSFHITVVDDVVPVANCDLHTIVSLTNDGPSGITLVPASVFDDGSYDNCGPVTFRARRMDSCIDFDWTTDGACIDDHPGRSTTGQ
ncbi:MAG: proprotein convertase P-domain-containing protein [Saprospiraceae bacterium]|nr:proprotein convertase P-domain-containing protein [Candidatus Opimibacter iunctus]